MQLVGKPQAIVSGSMNSSEAASIQESLVSGNGYRSGVRVAHMATRLIVAGLGNVVASLVRSMGGPRYSLTIICLEEMDVLGRILQQEGHDVVEMGKRRRRDLGLFFRLAHLLRCREVKIVHCHDELSWFYGSIAAHFAGINRVVVTMHGRRSDFSARHLLEQRLLAKLSRAIVCVSSYLKCQIQNELVLNPTKVPVIRNGIPIIHLELEAEARRVMRQSLGFTENQFVVGCIGRLDIVKNLDLLIDAFGKARSGSPLLKLVIVGEGPCRDALLQKVTRLGLSDAVQFTGLRRDVHNLLCSFDLYICSSDYEGISLSILEAMAAGKPVIATAVGGTVEIVSHEHTGILVPPRDVSAMATAIMELVQERSRCLRLGQEAKAFVEQNFNLTRMIHDYDQLYKSLFQVSRDFDRIPVPK